MSGPHKVASASSSSCGSLDVTTKGGVCMLEIRRAGMVKWGFNRQVVPVNQHEENDKQTRSVAIKEEQFDEEAVPLRSLISPGFRKRKCQDLGHASEAGGSRHEMQGGSSFSKNHNQSEGNKKGSSAPIKKEKYMSRWSIERYKKAEKNMLMVMKAEGAAFDNPISRPVLRAAARKYINDTGLLDHILKHIDGKLALGGTERFRRCYNTEGTMEYWLESADLVKIKRESGVPEPSRLPPIGGKPGDVSIQDSASTGELTRMKQEIADLKRGVADLVTKSGEQHPADSVQQMLKELSKWRSDADQRLMDISKSLSNMQDMYKGLVTWKAKAEQQLTDMSISISTLRASKQGWDDWWDGTNFDNLQGDSFAPWLENSDLINFGKDATIQELYSAPQPRMKSCDSLYQDPICAKDLELLKEEMFKMKRDFQEMVPKRIEEDRVVTPDSSVTANSKVDVESSAVVFQEMFKDWSRWKGRMEKQIQQLTNGISTLQASHHNSP